MSHFYVPENYMGTPRITDESVKDPEIEAYYFDVFGGKLSVFNRRLESGVYTTYVSFEINGKRSYRYGTFEIYDEEDFNETAACVISRSMQYAKEEKEREP